MCIVERRVAPGLEGDGVGELDVAHSRPPYIYSDNYRCSNGVVSNQ